MITGGARPSSIVEEPDWTLLIPKPIDGADDNSSLWRKLARREWNRIVSAMDAASTLAPENRHQLQRLVLAYIRYDLAASKLFATQAVVLTQKTKVPQLNMWQIELRAADQDATSAEMELGLSPRRRAAAGKVKAKAKAAGGAHGYLQAVKKA